ncbi:MAG: hypothetical protein HXY41_06205, partial [Chloroflexi bacterium]|nr:hypothetical protein [Chloroflexota bacterium]
APAAPPPAPAVAAPAPAAPPPAPAVPRSQQQTAPLTPVNVIVRRGMPNNAEMIATFISENTNKTMTRMDVMMAFGQKSYLLAQDAGEKVVGLVGWQVENLITRVDEFYLSPSIQAGPVVQELLVAIEQASRDLQSEVGYIFLPTSTAPDTLQTFLKNGYEHTTVEQIKIPAWREAVQELVGSSNTVLILTKKLREDRVLKPI